MQALLPQSAKALIFEMDGTIIDTVPHHSSTWKDFAKKHALEKMRLLVLKRHAAQACAPSVSAPPTQRKSWQGRTL